MQHSSASGKEAQACQPAARPETSSRRVHSRRWSGPPKRLRVAHRLRAPFAVARRLYGQQASAAQAGASAAPSRHRARSRLPNPRAVMALRRCHRQIAGRRARLRLRRRAGSRRRGRRRRRPSWRHRLPPRELCSRREWPRTMCSTWGRRARSHFQRRVTIRRLWRRRRWPSWRHRPPRERCRRCGWPRTVCAIRALQLQRRRGRMGCWCPFRWATPRRRFPPPRHLPRVEAWAPSRAVARFGAL
mmetsp:Transcript_17402/g.52519  ORF Transcript_17402/g.52519 Transcript_17402/m.52519 type:complete len:245 (-) Transcript_17402:1962-2696(-)